MCGKNQNNAALAKACGDANTWCCKDGFIFLPRNEYEKILGHLQKDTVGRANFLSRIADHGDFLLYNQQSRCQFLDKKDRCSLFDLGIRPTECFWWPAHVYLRPDKILEIRVSECCNGCQHVTKGDEFLQKVSQQAQAIGLPLLKRFREVHSYDVNFHVSQELQ